MINGGSKAWGLSRRSTCGTNQLVENMKRGYSRSERREEIGDECKLKVLLVSKLMLVILVLLMLRQEDSLKCKKSVPELHGEFQGNLRYREPQKTSKMLFDIQEEVNMRKLLDHREEVGARAIPLC